MDAVIGSMDLEFRRVDDNIIDAPVSFLRNDRCLNVQLARQEISPVPDGLCDSPLCRAFSVRYADNRAGYRLCAGPPGADLRNRLLLSLLPLRYEVLDKCRRDKQKKQEYADKKTF